MHPVLVPPDQLRPTGAHRLKHGSPQDPVLPVHLALGRRAAGALSGALLVGCAREMVFELAAEAEFGTLTAGLGVFVRVR